MVTWIWHSASLEEAAAAGADYVKFQTFSAETLVTKTAPKADYQKQATLQSETAGHEMIKKLELSKADHEKLMATVGRLGSVFSPPPLTLRVLTCFLI